VSPGTRWRLTIALACMIIALGTALNASQNGRENDPVMLTIAGGAGIIAVLAAWAEVRHQGRKRGD
jgi:hypothetical protein